MALRVDAAVLRTAVGEDLFRAGEDCLARGTLTGLEAAEGGAAAVVTEPGGPVFDTWVGVVDGVVTGECDCDGLPGTEAPREPCEHAIAVALAAVDAGITWASLRSGEDDEEKERERYRRAAEDLGLAGLVAFAVDLAMSDDEIAAELLARAEHPEDKSA